MRPRLSSRRFEPSTPAPEQRPGLGTEFGEARTSRVHDVSFVREAGRPFAVATLNYNDRRGVDALASVAARRDSARSVATGGGAVTISIRDASGDPLEAVHVGDRMFVVGQAGQRYSIVLQNHTSHRFEAVGTVDGLDVINGKPGTFDNRGYVLMPFATLEIEGFRTSTSAVAAFRFASVADSYAAQTGSARNVGVIGIAFFGEKGDSFVPESETRLRDTASPFPADPRFAQPPAPLSSTSTRRARFEGRELHSRALEVLSNDREVERDEHDDGAREHQSRELVRRQAADDEHEDAPRHGDPGDEHAEAPELKRSHRPPRAAMARERAEAGSGPRS